MLALKGKQLWLTLAGFTLGVLGFLLVPASAGVGVKWTVAMGLTMAFLWVTEAIPIPVTSLLPLIILPLSGIAGAGEAASYYGKPVIFLFLGGFILALGLENSGLHRRLALRIVLAIGSNLRTVVLGFMVASAFLSMWISNTAAVMVMLPIALAVLKEMEIPAEKGRQLSGTGAALMLGIAYAADIGGMATPVGTPPNLVYMEVLQQEFPAAPYPSFTSWMAFGAPLAVLFLLSGWFLLVRVILPVPSASAPSSMFRVRLQGLGKASFDEKASGIVFLVTALLWITGSRIDVGLFQFPGWRSVPALSGLHDASVAVMGATALFVIPSRGRMGERLMTWKKALGLPWGILLLFGGGFALAGAFQISGLSGLIGESVSHFDDMSPFLVVLIVTSIITFLTEFTSNTATATIILPVIASASTALGIDPRFLMIPATLACSCAFMMPVASPTQAIVFGSGYVSIRQMAKAGIWFNILGIILITAILFLAGSWLGMTPGDIPEWAQISPK